MATATAGLIPNWFPPTRENHALIVSIWQWFPLAASLQWLIPWYGMGKTSVTSRFNLPGRIGWLTMEAPGFLTLLYHMRTLTPTLSQNGGGEGLPWQNKFLATLFVTHYAYRALLFPFLQPSMSPLHVVIWLSGAAFQVTNGLAIGAWLAAYGPTTQAEWADQISTGQEIRRRAGRRAGSGKKDGKEGKNGKDGKGGATTGVDKHYEIPQAGLFKVMLYPHYFVEWVEWFGFWMAAGWGCVPARCFLLNEIAAMLPRAVSGRKWYVEKFGEEKIRGRWAVIPGVW
ncbi:uncharacterized protein B0H64DRAFT_458353 [Chaetomium fimeti]|uniref:3-oxo-5-alpha-steroid 4-dehydrogenase C-terminal domain-containing protein n=1 Tax=Chaetomium fimeti TaxID=1854472 RepID=A0AAE0HJN3_9PEZI|nr:hypothetical protein B0H64DRAFT_458353 [Chaetomium fimeti]